MADLSTSLAGVKLNNPLVLASGVRGNNASLLIRAAKEGAGAVTSKSCSLLPREGHPNPTMYADPKSRYLLNAIGLSNPGVEAEAKEIEEAVAKAGVPVIASVFAASADDFANVAARIAKAKPAMIELDISCPNVQREGEMFSSTKEAAAGVTKAVKQKLRASAMPIPVSVKLSANVPDIGAIAQECQKAGADCINAINTMPAMWIDVRAKRAVLANTYGGMSGPALLPIALRAVHTIRKSCPNIPIIGGGGVSSGEDAARMLMAGATAVSVGSAVYSRRNALGEIKDELRTFMQEENFRQISEICLEG